MNQTILNRTELLLLVSLKKKKTKQNRILEVFKTEPNCFEGTVSNWTELFWTEPNCFSSISELLLSLVWFSSVQWFGLSFCFFVFFSNPNEQSHILFIYISCEWKWNIKPNTMISSCNYTLHVWGKLSCLESDLLATWIVLALHCRIYNLSYTTIQFKCLHQILKVRDCFFI